ncbi:MAG: arginine--tRNA ligase [Candidatus Thermoplasmatota archaeon]
MQYAFDRCKQYILEQFQSILPNFPGELKLEIPPDETFGDFSFPCFQLTSFLKKPPQVIAGDLSAKIKKNILLADIQVKGPYINFFINNDFLISETLHSILSLQKTYGHLKKKNLKVIIEHTSANPNGPLHVGRARNPIIGDSLVRIFKAAGYSVQSQFYLDDMGKQVAILTWGVQHLDKKDIPQPFYDKPDHISVGYYQAAYKKMQEDEKVSEAIHELMKKAEQGDKQILELAKQAYTPVLEGIQKSLKRINITIDQYIPESQFVHDKSVEIVVKQLKESPYAHQEDKAWYLDLESFGIQGRNTKFFFIRQDGTTLYATRDIAYHRWKATQADLLINILGEDHKLESKQVAIALQILGVKKIPTVVFYAFVSLPEGKMSTRRGRVVYLDELIDECIEHAYVEVKKRRGSELSEAQMKKIAEIVGLGSLRYNIIKVQPEKDIVFTWEDALNFEGNAVPFIQYAHARACSILAKADDRSSDIFFSNLLIHPSEIKLVKQLARYPNVIEAAAQGFKPHLIANYLNDIASAFNQFYRDCPVLSETNLDLQKSRLAVVHASKIVLGNALDLLGIAAPEEM